MAEAFETSVPQMQLENAEQQVSQLKAGQPQRQVGSSVQTPEITGGDDIGGHLSDDAGNEVAKGESGAVKAVHQQHNFDASDTMSTQGGNVMARTGSTPPPDAVDKAEGDLEGRQHHLLRHSLPTEQRGTSVLSHFGVETVSDAAKSIKKMSQRDLQAKFKAVYGTKTFSNNNNWLRRKLFEAIGMDPGKSATKKASAGGPRRRRATSTVKSTSTTTATRRIKPPLRYARRSKAELEEEQHSVAEALLALADTSETPLLKETRRVQQAIHSDGIVPGRDDVSELSWSSRGRDVPAVKEEPALHQSTQLPTAPPLVDSSQEAMMSSMMEYFTMMQRMMMHQSPENQNAMMSMLSAQQSPTQQAQMLQQMQQFQQFQQMQLMMAMQSNPNVMQMMQQSYSNPHAEYVKTLQDAIAAQTGTGGSHAFAMAQSGSLQGSYPDIFMSPKTK